MKNKNQKQAFTLAKVFSAHSVGYCKNAFTLAEVLITLGIIGIVAAMTLPTLITRYQEKARVVKLKKIYSQLQNAFNLAIAEHGDIDSWGLTTTNTEQTTEEGTLLDNAGRITFFANVIEPYFTKVNSEAFLEAPSTALDGRQTSEGGIILDPSTKKTDMNILTSDGYILTMGWISKGGVSGDFWVLLPNEKKSIIGVTKFRFTFDKKGFHPDGENNQARFHTYCDIKGASAASQNGRACTAWAIYEENMEYLRCNDLEYGGKNKCK